MKLANVNPIESFEQDFSAWAKNRLDENVYGECSQLLQQAVVRGLPTKKNEDWKYNNLKGLTQKPWRAVVEPAKVSVQKTMAFQDIQLSPEAVSHLVFVDGFLVDHLSQIATELMIESLPLKGEFSTGIIPKQSGVNETDEDLFGLLNRATTQNANLIKFTGKKPHYVFLTHILTSGEAADIMRVVSSQHRFEVAQGSELTIVEHFISDFISDDKSALNNYRLHAHVGENASLYYYRLQDLTEEVYQFANISVELERSARLNLVDIALGGIQSRSNVVVQASGEGTSSSLKGLFLSKGEQVVDNHTSIRHLKPNGESHQLYKGILSGKGRGIFNGKIYIAQDAQKVNSSQLNKNLLLSDKAEVDTKPELEIYADDVKATHGAAIGQLDAEQIFYLQSRAIAKEQAVKMVATGYAQEVTGFIKQQEIRETFENVIASHLEQHFLNQI